MTEFSDDPEARAAYSNNPQFKEGASSTPDVELLQQPEVVEAMDSLVGSLALYKHGRLKFKRPDAEQIISSLEVVTPHLQRRDPESTNGPWDHMKKMEDFVTDALEVHRIKTAHLDA